MKFVYITFLIVVLILGISFAILNANPVAINYFLGKKLLPLSFLLSSTLIVGTLIGWIAGLILFFKQKVKNRKLKQRLQLLEQELNNIRSMPLRDSH